MAAPGCGLAIALLVVAGLAHELGAVLLCQVLADKLVLKVLDGLALGQVLDGWHCALRLLQLAKELHLHGANSLLLVCFGARALLSKDSTCLWEESDLPLGLCHHRLTCRVLDFARKRLFLL